MIDPVKVVNLRSGDLKVTVLATLKVWNKTTDTLHVKLICIFLCVFIMTDTVLKYLPDPVLTNQPGTCYQHSCFVYKSTFPLANILIGI